MRRVVTPQSGRWPGAPTRDIVETQVEEAAGAVVYAAGLNAASGQESQ
jgi:hypothetical protein